MSAPCPTLGFHLAFTVDPAVAEARRASVRGAFFAALSAHGLVGAPATDDGFVFVITGDGTQATESDREQLVAWLDRQPEVARRLAGPLIDLR